jgi:hypothetical protein
MSFNNYARKVRNPRLDLPVRRSALASCILRLAWLTKRSYLATRAPFAARYNLDRPRQPDEEELLEALVAIERERNRFLERVRAFERRRIREKLRGRRHPRPADIAAIYAPTAEAGPTKR